MTSYKYPKIAAFAIAALLTLGSLPALGQYSRAPKVRMTPRALGVLEIDGKGKARLFPVMIMIEGKMYDASFYASKPVPLALYTETVYEGQKSGMPAGLFTINQAWRQNKLWWGQGTWAPIGASKKKGSSKSASSGKSAAPVKSTANADDDPDRPVFKRQIPVNPPPVPEQKPPSGEAKVNTGSTSPDDSDRPTLRRGKPTEESKPLEMDTQPFVMADEKTKPLIGAPVETMAAISDAVPTDNRPFDMTLSPDEQEHLGKEIADKAWAELKKFAANRAPIPATPAFTNVKSRSFDLDYSNNPLLVFTAEFNLPGGTKIPAGGTLARSLTYYVTYVGKVDLEGRLNKLFSSVTDNMHLDAYARLEFIDAVDADADGRGELLFKEITDIDRKYVLYRASPGWSMMFEGGSGQ